MTSSTHLKTELTDKDIPLTDTSAERKAKLHDWGFICKCSLCTAPASHVAASDSRRKELALGIERMMAALTQGDIRGALQTIQMGLEYLEDEGLEGLSGDMYESLARIYWAMGQKKLARENGILSVGFRTDYGGNLEVVNKTRELEELLLSFDA
jgi:hypothetical protein